MIDPEEAEARYRGLACFEPLASQETIDRETDDLDCWPSGWWIAPVFLIGLWLIARASAWALL